MDKSICLILIFCKEGHWKNVRFGPSPSDQLARIDCFHEIPQIGDERLISIAAPKKLMFKGLNCNYFCWALILSCCSVVAGWSQLPINQTLIRLLPEALKYQIALVLQVREFRLRAYGLVKSFYVNENFKGWRWVKARMPTSLRSMVICWVRTLSSATVVGRTGYSTVLDCLIPLVEWTLDLELLVQ